MKITVKLYAGLGEYLPAGAEDNAFIMETDRQLSAEALIERMRVPPKQAHLVLLNGVYLQPDERDTTIVGDGDVLAMWPPVAGG